MGDARSSRPGSTRPPPGGRGPCISGALATAHRRIVTEIWGEDAWARALTLLPPEHREEIEGLTSLGDLPITTAEAMFGALSQVVGRDAASLHEQVARTSVEQNLKTIWRILFRFTSDDALVGRTPVIFGKSYSQGTLAPRIISPGRADIRITNWPHVPEYAVRGTRVGIETVLRLAGRTNVRVATERTHDGVLYVTTWTP